MRKNITPALQTVLYASALSAAPTVSSLTMVSIDGATAIDVRSDAAANQGSDDIPLLLAHLGSPIPASNVDDVNMVLVRQILAQQTEEDENKALLVAASIVAQYLFSSSNAGERR